jgi:hypothetical protein
MAEPEISCSHKILQVIKNLNVVPFSALNKVFSVERNTTKDPVLLFALYSRLKEICVGRKLQSMCAPFCGLNMDFFIYTMDGENFTGIYECDYEGAGEYYPIVSSCVNCLDEHGRMRRFLCEKNTMIKAKGQHLVIDKDMRLIQMEKEFQKLEALIIQNECDNIAQNFVVNSGIEVEINNYAPE